MEKRFEKIKGIINEYEVLVKNGPSLVVDTKSEEIKKEIKEIKNEISMLLTEVANKSRIEQMKNQMKIISLENDIQLKKEQLEEIRENIESEKASTKQEYENKMLDLEDEIVKSLKKFEDDLYDSIVEENEDVDIVLSKDLEEIRDYYQKIYSTESKNLEITKEELRSIESKKFNITIFGIVGQVTKSQERLGGNHRNYEKEDTPFRKELEKWEKEKSKKESRVKAIEDKLAILENMLDEMLYEVIQEEIQKREIDISKIKLEKTLKNLGIELKFFVKKEEVKK